ncbi:hypothetical protein [Desulfobulbus sp.]|uniref:hypothetical protein n=1 Tax=Desulfobulbus sp. TaxID=895 RepID=UPI00286F52CA|nr:hypothetical protein [Desulfobulbus sp.]
MIRICCVCHRVERQGTWHAGLFLAEHQRLTHGYCPDCFAEAMAEIEEFCGIAAQRTLGVESRSTVGGQRG